VTILLADQHGTTHRAVEAVARTRPAWSLRAIATNAEEAVACTVLLAPDVVLVDIGLPGRRTIDLIPELRRAVPPAAVIVLSITESDALAREFARRGAAGYLLKQDVGLRLTDAVEGRVGQSVRDDIAIDGRETPVTAREREVLALLADGRRNEEVAQTLGISRKTVETHRARIMRKLDLHSMSALVRYAIRHHLIEA